VVAKFIPKRISGVVGTGQDVLETFFRIEIPDVEKKLVEAMMKKDVDYVDSLLEAKDEVASAIPRNAPKPDPAKGISEADCIAAIDEMTARLNATEVADYRREIAKELATYKENVASIGMGFQPPGEEGRRVAGWIEAHWIDLDGSGKPERQYLAQVSMHPQMSVLGCMQWNYHFIRWVKPEYGAAAVAEAEDQKDTYVEILGLPSALLQLNPKKPLVTDRYIGSQHDLNGKLLQDALGEGAQHVDREHELQGVKKPHFGSVYSRWSHEHP
jgi:hypothetical protein